jgi:hypothetical protein
MKLTNARLHEADSVVDHLCLQITALQTVGDPMRDRYVGFCALTIATHAESTIKDLILDFCKAENRYLHAVFDKELERFNARIAHDALSTLLLRFDESHSKRFKELCSRVRRAYLVSSTLGYDPLASYKSMLGVRHSFVHNINANFTNITVTDLRKYSQSAKLVVAAFGRSIGN